MKDHAEREQGYGCERIAHLEAISGNGYTFPVPAPVTLRHDQTSRDLRAQSQAATVPHGSLPWLGLLPNPGEHPLIQYVSGAVSAAESRPPSSGRATSTGSTPESTATSAPVKVPRPPNAWILYRSDQIAALRESTPVGAPRPTQAELSKIFGHKWRGESPMVKLKYERAAETAREMHSQKYPEWKFARRAPKAPNEAGTSTANKSKSTVHTDLRKPRVIPIPSRAEQPSPSTSLQMPATRIEPPPLIYDSYSDQSHLYPGMPQDPHSHMSAGVHSHILSYDHPNAYDMPITYGGMYSGSITPADGNPGTTPHGRQPTGVEDCLPAYISPVWVNNAISSQQIQHADYPSSSPYMMVFEPQFGGVSEQPIRRVSACSSHQASFSSHQNGYSSSYPSLCRADNDFIGLEGSFDEYGASTPGVMYITDPGPNASQYRPA